MKTGWFTDVIMWRQISQLSMYIWRLSLRKLSILTYPARMAEFEQMLYFTVSSGAELHMTFLCGRHTGNFTAQHPIMCVLVIPSYLGLHSCYLMIKIIVCMDIVFILFLNIYVSKVS